MPLIASERSFKDNSLSDWLGRSYGELNIVATYNLMYNAAVMVASGIGTACGCIRLNCKYDGTSFVPASPMIPSHAVFAWKKAISQSRTTAAFIEFAKKYINNITADRK